MARQICAGLELDEGVGAKQLIKSSKGLKRRSTAPEATILIAAWQNHSAEQAQDRSTAQTRPHLALESQRCIAHAAVPCVILVLEFERNIDLNLVVHTESLF